MRFDIAAAAAAFLLIGLPAQSFAQVEKDRASPSAGQVNSPQTFTHGESKRCEGMTGAEKEQCDRDEATKGQGSPSQDVQPAATGGSAPQKPDRGTPATPAAGSPAGE